MDGINTLAGYDMVLTLSQNTINYQFEQLHKLNVIQKKWGVLAGNIEKNGAEKSFHISNEDENFKKKLNDWINIQDEISKAKAANDWSKVGELINRAENEKINFNFGWDTNLAAPVITIKEKESHSLLLEIRFKKGKLYYKEESIAPVKIYELKDTVYAFNVPIGQLEVNKKSMVLNTGGQVTKIIRESGLTEQDFTIESLFLNFENANISIFDKNKSTFPDNASKEFSRAVEEYFNLMIKNSENPYVLGYGVRRKKIKATEKAMFQPTSLGFTTSYSSHLKKAGMFSGLNFLMMLNDTKSPTTPTAGILPQSILELEKDITSTTDGVFAIRKEHFSHYIDSLDTYVEEVFKKLEGVEIKQSFTDGIMEAERDDKKVDDTIVTKYTVVRQEISGNDGVSVKISYEISINIEVKVHAWFVEVGKKTLSTSGQYTKDALDKAGRKGRLDFIIKAGKTGRFDLEHLFEKPIVAFDENPDLFGNGFLKDLLKVLTLIVVWVAVVIEGIVNQIAVDLGKESVVDNDKLLQQLNSIDVLNQTNKIILPLGNVYTFKNLRIVEDKGIVAYDIGYAPVVQK
ncbi:hypothetical protein [Tenacibaculum aestuarii]|uniref:hypothetical protein n=1 Tax=Tenacibaculum aestuarii TaxID=362781 RepID=UPI0038944288